MLCVPSAAHLSQLDLGGVRVALYPANTGRNIHLLRIPTMQHVFLAPGGDGDEAAAVDPYSKVYDQVWVAGEAGRRRHVQAAVGVEDADIVEIGRPQLDGLRVAGTGHTPAPLPTVLYAPTGDGAAGEPIVRALLDSERPLRAALPAASPHRPPHPRGPRRPPPVSSP
ncbi:Aromatic ring-opening dioxygenase LigA OS=Streptomyces antimycoticus OX=68175 GN=SANT12839_040770 PE=4 SV=1 [Streptomyces antimycoticus]